MALKGKFRGTSPRRPARGGIAEKPDKGLSLIEAVQNGDHDALRRLLKSGADTEETNGRGETALMLAALLGDMEALRLLVESGADVDAVSKLSLTSLMAAAQNGDVTAMRYLISKGADVNARKKDGTTILMVAAMFGHHACVDELIAQGADLYCKDIYGYTAQMLAAGSDDCEQRLAAAAARDREKLEAESVVKARPPKVLRKALSGAGKKLRETQRAARKEKNVLLPDNTHPVTT